MFYNCLRAVANRGCGNVEALHSSAELGHGLEKERGRKANKEEVLTRERKCLRHDTGRSFFRKEEGGVQKERLREKKGGGGESCPMGEIAREKTYLQYFPAVGGIELVVAMTMSLDSVEEVPVKQYTYLTTQLHVCKTIYHTLK